MEKFSPGKNGLSVYQIAAVCHDANRRLQIIQSDPAPSPLWDDCHEWQSDSALDGVQKALQGHTPQMLHESWCEFKVNDGWTYGPVKDSDDKTHPCLVPYSQLPEDQRIKDKLFLRHS